MSDGEGGITEQLAGDSSKAVGCQIHAAVGMWKELPRNRRSSERWNAFEGDLFGCRCLIQAPLRISWQKSFLSLSLPTRLL